MALVWTASFASVDNCSCPTSQSREAIFRINRTTRPLVPEQESWSHGMEAGRLSPPQSRGMLHVPRAAASSVPGEATIRDSIVINCARILAGGIDTEGDLTIVRMRRREEFG